jgi:general stress protein YciG
MAVVRIYLFPFRTRSPMVRISLFRMGGGYVMAERNNEGSGSMSREEAGRMGGERVKDLIEKGKRAEENGGENRSNSESHRSSGTRGGTPEQHAEAGRKGGEASHGGQNSPSGSESRNGGTRGGTHEQHVKAGQQSHKNS